MLVALTFGGCAAFHPIRGVPAPYVPPEFLGPSRSGKRTIDLSLLVQTQPDEYRVAAKDVLSIYIPGVLGPLNVDEDRQIGETPPINTPSNPGDPPTIGYPVTVRGNGTIALPYIPPINVHGMTLPEIEIAIRQAYTAHSGVLNGEQDRVLVSLQRRREYSVLVVRQETSSELTQGGQPGTLNIANTKRGTARTVRLPAYENDVLHALASSEQGADGLPGLNAKNTIYIIRRKKAPPAPSPERPPDPSESENIRRAPADSFAFPNSLPDQRIPVQPNPAPSHPPMGDVDSQIIEMQIPRQPVLGAPQKPVPGTPESLPAFTPPPQEVSPPHSQQNPRTNDTLPGKHQTAPTWPSPADPPQSIQRTSRENRAARAPAVWPAVRGQSPEPQGIWGHSREIPARQWSNSITQTDSADQPVTAMPRNDPRFGSTIMPATSRDTLQTQMVNHASYGHAPYGQVVPHQRQGETPQSALGMPTSASPTLAPRLDAFANVGGHDSSWQDALVGFDPTVENPNVVKIPIRLADGEYPTFTERDIILNDGDIVFIESRETEVFYTGGLLGGGQYTLPRDYDLRVLEAISIAQSQNNITSGGGRSIGGVSALNQDVTISASHIVILRSLPNGTRIPIEVDLYKAVRRPQENILIQPGDLVILQYTKVEAVAAFFERHLLEGAMFGIAAAYLNNPGSGGN